MKRTLPLALLALVTLSSAQETPEIETSLDVSLYNKYVWRGVNYVNDWVLQPDLGFSMEGFSLSFWGNFELTNWNGPNYPRSPKGRLTELDTTITYGQSFGQGAWKFGYIDYQFPGTGSERYGEWLAAIEFDNSPFAPSVTLYRGTRDGMGTYVEVNASHDFQTAGQSLTLGGQFGYGDKKSNEFYYGNAKNALTHVQLDLSTEFSAGKGWSFTPSVSYSTLLEKGHLNGQARRSNFWFGLSFTRAF